MKHTSFYVLLQYCESLELVTLFGQLDPDATPRHQNTSPNPPGDIWCLPRRTTLPNCDFFSCKIWRNRAILTILWIFKTSACTKGQYQIYFDIALWLVPLKDWYLDALDSKFWNKYITRLLIKDLPVPIRSCRDYHVNPSTNHCRFRRQQRHKQKNTLSPPRHRDHIEEQEGCDLEDLRPHSRR